MAVTARKHDAPLVGREKPRIAPPIPARSLVKEFEETSNEIGLTLMPWQRTAGRYLYGLRAGDRWLYPEVAVVVARQNGKTTLLRPHIIQRLKMGRRILHAAQTRELPRSLFDELLPDIAKEFGFRAKVRKGAGQETIQIQGGGFYKIVAASGGAPRGLSIDDLLLDEVRQLDQDFIGAAIPTTMASSDPQILYLSNAGSEESLALNSIRARAGDDESLAYLEWSADPKHAADSLAGWAEANPALGHNPTLVETLTRKYRSDMLGGTMSHFETENLCRWVTTLREKLVDDTAWLKCHADLPKPLRPSFGVSLDPDHKRGSVAMAWMSGTKVCLRLVANVSGDPIDPDALGDELRKSTVKFGIPQVGFDPLTDAHLAKYASKGKAKPITGQAYAVASAHFVTLVQSGALMWDDADPITDDLTWTARKPDGDAGSYHAVRSKDDRPITAALAAIRAVWLASGPTQPSAPRIR